MTTHLHAVAGGMASIAAATFGSQIFTVLGLVTPAPEWMELLLGPLGALVGMAFAIWWLSQRLNRAEEKSEKREDDRDKERTAMLTALTENTNVLREVKESLTKRPH